MAVSILYWITVAVAILFFICAFYRGVFLFMPLFQKRRAHRPTEIRKIGVLISARNEEKVLPYLLDSLRKQDYPADMFRVFVVADNCEDRTAEVARAGGAIVFERNNLKRIGKGYALNFLLREIQRDFGDELCDAYLVCDADNVLEPNYISEMNKVYCDGYSIVAGVRNAKNFFSGWISSGYSIYFMYRAQFLNRSRMQCGSPAFVSGTGFLFDRKLLDETDGWQFFSMSEDTEFTACFLLKGAKIGYAEKAVLYDEQPTKFSALWKQRGRWMKGRLQTLRAYFCPIMAAFFKKPRFAYMDFLLSLFLLDAIGGVFLLSALATAILAFVQTWNVISLVSLLLATLTCTYAVYFALGSYTVISEWDSLHAKPEQKLLAILTYPIFMVLDIPLMIRALFSRAKWISIPHSDPRSLEDVKEQTERSEEAQEEREAETTLDEAEAEQEAASAELEATAAETTEKSSSPAPETEM